MNTSSSNKALQTKHIISFEDPYHNIMVFTLVGFDDVEKNLLKQQITPYLLSQKLKPKIWKKTAWQLRALNTQQEYRSYFADFVAETSDNLLVLCQMLPISDQTEREEYQKKLAAEKNYLSYYISQDFVLLISNYQGFDEIESELEEQNFKDSLEEMKEMSKVELFDSTSSTTSPIGCLSKHYFEGNIKIPPQINSQTYLNSFPEQDQGRIQKMLQKTLDSIIPGITFSRCLDGSCWFHAVIDGPSESVYEGGKFKLEYTYFNPYEPPIVRFKTKMYHPNISSHGQICMDLLHSQFCLALSSDKMVLCIQSLLTDPNPESPLVPSIGALYLSDREKYNQKCREWTKLYAMN